MAKKTTKRALFLSVMSLFICFTMLIGTTYAWFTDSVTSTGNIIKTGTLDVTLEYSKELLTDKDSDKWIDASTGAIFNHGNWEPGYTEVRYVKVENEGSLDLKFMLSIIPSEKTADNEPNLADVIDVYIAKTAVSVDRNLTDLILVGTLSDLINDPDGAAYGVLYDKDEAGADTADEKVCVETYTLVLKMQETAGNEYQNRTVGGTFAVQLLATQLASESDDLGNDYDAEATYPDVVIDNTEKEEGKAAKVATQDENGNDEVVVDIPEGAPAGNYSLEVTDKQEITDANGNTTIYMDITLKKDGAKVTVDPNGNVFYTVSVNVGAGRVFNKLVHDGKEITDYDYDTVSGIVKFTTDSFSPFEFGYYEVNIEAVKTPDEFAAAVVVGGTVKLEGVVDVAEPIVIPEAIVIPEDVEVVIDLNGRTITAGDDGYALLNESGAKVVLTDSVGGGEIKGTVSNANGSVMTINGGIYTAVSKYAILNDAATLTINSATINGTAATYPIYSYNDGHQLTINDVTINGVFGALNAYGEGKVVINGGTYNMTGVSGKTSHILYFSTTATVVINGGSFNHIGDLSMSATGGGGICLNGSSNVTVNGGSFNGDYADFYTWSNSATLTIKGGTFAHAPEAKYIASGYFLDDNGDGTSTVLASVYVGENGFATLQDAVNAAENGATIVLYADVTVAEPVMIPEGKEIVIELNGKSLSTTDKGTIYAINNHGTLTIKDSVGTGTVNARGIYNGYNASGDNIATAKITVEGGTFNAMGTNGGAAIYNYGILDIKGGTFTSNGGYGLNNQATGVTTVSGATVKGGIYNSGGTLTIDETDILQHLSGKHAIYNWCGNVTINSGNFDSLSGNELILADGSNATVTINGGTFDKTAKSWLFGAATGKNITFVINGGTFNGYVNLPENSVDTIRPYGDPIVVYGGTYNFNPTTWVADGHIVIENADGTYSAFEGVVVSTTDELVAAINAGATKVYLNSGDYALRFTNNTNFNVDGMTLKGLGDVKLAISSSEAWYGRVQGSNVTFENIHFTSAVGATGKATYNNCAFDSWTICASSNKEETYFNNCAINGCLNTSTDFSSGDVYVKNCTVVKAEYSGSMTVNFESCEIGEVIIWNSNTNFTNCDVTTMNLDNVSTATVMIDGVVAK